MTSISTDRRIALTAEREGWTVTDARTGQHAGADAVYTRDADTVAVWFNGAGSITTVRFECRNFAAVVLGRRDSDKAARVSAWLNRPRSSTVVAAEGTDAPAVPTVTGKQTYSAVLPDGRTVTRSSATMAYTHVLVVRRDGETEWFAFSWHKSADAAHRAANSGARYSAANYAERRVIAVTSAPYASTEAKNARAAEKNGTVGAVGAVGAAAERDGGITAAAAEATEARAMLAHGVTPTTAEGRAAREAGMTAQETADARRLARRRAHRAEREALAARQAAERAALEEENAEAARAADTAAYDAVVKSGQARTTAEGFADVVPEWPGAADARAARATRDARLASVPAYVADQDETGAWRVMDTAAREYGPDRFGDRITAAEVAARRTEAERAEALAGTLDTDATAARIRTLAERNGWALASERGILPKRAKWSCGVQGGRYLSFTRAGETVAVWINDGGAVDSARRTPAGTRTSDPYRAEDFVRTRPDATADASALTAAERWITAPITSPAS
ncbi:hypothetical protein Mbo2_103 [Rhodococcus phage Mbo2]|uniref:Uncharacterized protein n=1 Tax=Rhodococcus phage Mbo2 TaxID=2936911 RepID=A0A9E7IN76_9CAUD|nr:hypothetical protein Mbo2_103 [Rhodococcus phage Mbo2]